MKLFAVIAGPNGSGKSSSISYLKSAESPLLEHNIQFSDLTYINADICAVRDSDIAGMPAGKEKDLAAWNAVNEWRNQALLEGINIIWETVFSHPSRLEEIHKAHRLGYYVIVIYVTTLSPEINVERVKIRVSQNGHDVPVDKIHSRYHRTTALLPDIITAADEVYVYDNSGLAPRLTFSKKDGKYIACDEAAIGPERYEWMINNILRPLAKRRIEADVYTLQELQALYVPGRN